MRLRKFIAGVVCLGATCLAAPSAAGAVSLDQVGSYADPVYVTSDPSDPDRLFVVERAGRIQLTTPSGTSQFLNITNLVESGYQERGLLSMAFAPDYASSGLFYVYYTGTGDGAIHVAELKASGDTADPRTIRNVITIPHPTFPNHNGGQLQFGRDGYLYFATGDGGAADDPSGNGQNLGSLLGKLIRIDPRGTNPNQYTVPADNPFVGASGAQPEIWSYGLRNPYRFSFDRINGDLVIADVGQNTYEEVDYAQQPAAGKGVNYGWRCREGLHPNPNPNAVCTVAGTATDPVLEYTHSAGGCSITGGYVVRDPGLDELAGRYAYADYCRGTLRSTLLATPAATDDRSEGLQIDGPSSFGEDACGRLYVASLNDGTVSRLVDATPTDCTAFGGTPPTDPSARCAEVLDGTGRKNKLDGGAGGQRIDGKGAADKLKGGDGDDCLLGGAGKDTLTGGAGVDTLRGGSGADRIEAADGERDLVTCGDGNDVASVDRNDRVRGCERVHRPKRKD